ncbi:leucyl aminopeptidase, partial [Candidatus Woesearchaeota archaeon]|nr:leucyl aminopeptidase [Candidatus Woesearchaeota archaeon]
MKITISSTLDQKQPVLVLGLFEENKSVNLVNSLLDKELDDELSDAQKNKEFSSKFGELYSTKISKLPYRRIVVLGLGKKKELDAEKVRKLWGKTINAVKALKQVGFTTNLALLFSSVIKEELLGKATAEGLLLANYSFNKYLSKERQDKKKPIAEVSIQWKNSVNDFEKGINTGKIIAEATNFSRDLVNEPASVVNSLYLEKAARDIAKSSSKLKMHVLDEPEMKKLGMGALLGVNAGSKNPPKLIFLEYSGGGKEKPSAFIGKGITFDSGGYNLKPTKYIEDMHTDMGGAAAVLGTIKAAAELGVKNNLVGVMAVCENMVSDTAQHPGTIVKAFNGKSIVVGNTDAEGRLVLADALAYTQKKYN